MRFLFLALPTALLLAGCATAPMQQATQAAMGTATGDYYTDANVAATATASNMMEIQPSQLALERTQTAAVRQFAQRMIAEHTALQQQMERLLAARGMAPVDNAMSATLKRNLEPTLAMLRPLSGMQFDMNYMMQQVASHQLTLHTLDTTLIPTTENAELRSMLTEQVRPAVAAHLQEAMRIMHGMHGM